MSEICQFYGRTNFDGERLPVWRMAFNVRIVLREQCSSNIFAATINRLQRRSRIVKLNNGEDAKGSGCFRWFRLPWSVDNARSKQANRKNCHSFIWFSSRSQFSSWEANRVIGLELVGILCRHRRDSVMWHYQCRSRFIGSFMAKTALYGDLKTYTARCFSMPFKIIIKTELHWQESVEKSLVD